MTKKVMLFYADWCGHCKRFEPVWQHLKKEFSANGIEHEEHESKEEKIMEQFDIQGFPTIKIEEEGVVSEYRGSRDPDSILTYLGVDVSQTAQAGGGLNGSSNELMKSRYLTYKKLYLDLKTTHDIGLY